MRQQAEFEQTVAIPENNPLASKLVTLFGDHTFFLNGEGLHIVEAEDSDADKPECQVIKLASWSDAGHTSLAPQEREPAELVVVLRKEAA
ncbi:MAG TPA: hypothetical protein VLX85_06790 [Stellaceae bacterium]|nr:hypothetical protein [Stellaceae bacterium]